MSQSSNDELYNRLVSDIKVVAEDLQKEPHTLLMSEYLPKSDGFDKGDLIKCGGFNKILKAAFPNTGKNLPLLHAQSQQIAYTSKLEKRVGAAEFNSDQFLREIKQLIQTNRPPAQGKIHVVKKPKLRRENTVVISDTHFGLKINKNEVRCNEYNWIIAARRLAYVAKQAVSYKINHREECPQLRVCLGGDMLHGIIHPDEAGGERITEQVFGAYYLLTQFVRQMRFYYSRVVLECTVGNHDRINEKRQMTQKWDSYATMLYGMLACHFDHDSNVVVNFERSLDIEFDVLGNRFYMTHGDTGILPGNVGGKINIDALTRDITKVQMANLDKRYAAFIFGHVHVPVNTSTNSGVSILINGSLSGTDAYAKSINIQQSNPVQTIFEVTEDHPVGDWRKLEVKYADEDVSYDSVIQPYDNNKNNILTAPPKLPKMKL